MFLFVIIRPFFLFFCLSNIQSFIHCAFLLVLLFSKCTYAYYLFRFLLCFTGCVVACGHSNHFNDTKSRHNKKSTYWHHQFRAQNLDNAHQGYQGERQGLVHVPNKYGPDEESNGLSGCGG